MTEREAQLVAQEYIDYLNRLSSLSSHPYEAVICEEHTRTEDFGWIFFYQSKSFLESGDPLEALLGNAPLIIDSKDGSLHHTGTAHDIDHYIRNYRAIRCTAKMHYPSPR